MSQQDVTTYSPEAVVLVIDGVLLEGLAEDGIQIEYPGESELTEGMDSGTTYEFNPSRVKTVTATFRAASVGARRLEEIRADVEDQIRNANPHPVINGIASDPINGSEATGQVFFLNRPVAQFGMKSGTVAFKMAFVNGEHRVASNV